MRFLVPTLESLTLLYITDITSLMEHAKLTQTSVPACCALSENLVFWMFMIEQAHPHAWTTWMLDNNNTDPLDNMDHVVSAITTSSWDTFSPGQSRGLPNLPFLEPESLLLWTFKTPLCFCWGKESGREELVLTVYLNHTFCTGEAPY